MWQCHCPDAAVIVDGENFGQESNQVTAEEEKQEPEGCVSIARDTSETMSDGESRTSGEQARAAVKQAQRLSREMSQAMMSSVQDPRPLHVEPVNAGPGILGIDSLDNSAHEDGDQEVAEQNVIACDSHSDQDTPRIGFGVSPISEVTEPVSPGFFDFDELERSMVNDEGGESSDDSGPGMVDSSDDEPSETWSSTLR